ncbi:hypothetical protein FHW67_002766 [Herbaspirillum sp. Sphag1AN]|uniref:hypothetical protein n=1 Tax=unclassified Herbaspirillum TaxID=2624150 RepID=UPI00160B3C8E|nr:MULTISPECIES: hypothetical protein [unclassified Herbaspirillum]MBB3213474.1 hypothetical protein [Herbaspirillum sp. Sphag1AN]MBB3246482.1 hypothetical protein [Herbaspirillum sp. Sphag64]
MPRCPLPLLIQPLNPTHEELRWIHGPGKNERFADFIGHTCDVAAGIRSSLQIIYSGDLVREINLDGDADDFAPPAVGKADAANLMRLSIAAASLLQQVSRGHIDLLNTYWPEYSPLLETGAIGAEPDSENPLISQLHAVL